MMKFDSVSDIRGGAIIRTEWSRDLSTVGVWLHRSLGFASANDVSPLSVLKLTVNFILADYLHEYVFPLFL
jgi:hypothetical protein